MERTRRITVPPDLPSERLDRFLAASCPDLTRSQIQKLIADGQVCVEDRPAKAGNRLKGGETLTLTVPPPVVTEIQAQPIPLNILFQDRHLMVIDKPAGLVVHPAPGHRDDTLVNALLFHCRDLSGIGGELRPGIVHRLDKDTSGVLLATKSDQAHQHLAKQFKDHSIHRTYLALVHGLVQNNEGVVDRPIGRHPVHRKKMSSHSRSGRSAVTRWKVLRRFDRDRLSLLELRLQTGRTHQIRVHFSEMHLPLVGDPVYGSRGRSNALVDLTLRQLVKKLDRQALHARTLGFIHPETGAAMEFTSPIPEDMACILRYLDQKYGSTSTDFPDPADTSGDAHETDSPGEN